MKRFLPGIGLGLALLLGPVPALAQKAQAQKAPEAEPKGMVLDRVVAAVNDEAITLSEVQEEGQPVIRKIFQDFVGPERDRRVDEAEQKLVADLISRRLMIQVAKKEGMLPSGAEVSGAIEDLKKQNNVASDAQFQALLQAEGLTMDLLRRSVEERLAINRLLMRQIRSAIIVNEDEIQKYYETHPDKFQRIPEAQIRHIFIEVPPGADEAAAKAKAEEALAKVRAGTDFGEIAKQYSDGPTKDKGGELGAIHKGDLAPEIEGPAFSLPPGGVSPLIRTAAGWNIIKVERVRTETVAPYAEVRDTIRNQLFQEKFETKRKEWIAKLRAQAFIEILMQPAALRAEVKPPDVTPGQPPKP
jgi:parvulin-like peptidyl-prolyl isomerase